jgi:predicted phosphodiesterase
VFSLGRYKFQEFLRNLFLSHATFLVLMRQNALPAFPPVHPRIASSILKCTFWTRLMRILILSDIHANLTALEAALAKAKGSYDVAVCLGDIVGYGPDPAEVSDEVRQVAKSSIRGNHDKAVAGLMSTEDFNPVAKAAVDWTRAQLSPEQLKWLADLPQGPKETDGIVLVHGAFQDEDEYVFTPAQALEGLLDSSAPITFFGHTHHQGGFAYYDSNLEILQIRPRLNESFAPLRIEPDRRYLLNPGSIGQPRDADPRAAFAIADLENHTVEFWRVPYEIGKVQSRMRKAGLPEPLVQRLEFGR